MYGAKKRLKKEKQKGALQEMIGFSSEQGQKRKFAFFAITMLIQGFTYLSKLQNIRENLIFLGISIRIIGYNS